MVSMIGQKVDNPISIYNVGFDWGPMRVTRLTDDPKGGVYISVKSIKSKKLLGMDIRISPGGKVVEVETYGDVKVSKYK
jgi:hypothetical protein